MNMAVLGWHPIGNPFHTCLDLIPQIPPRIGRNASRVREICDAHEGPCTSANGALPSLIPGLRGAAVNRLIKKNTVAPMRSHVRFRHWTSQPSSFT